MNPTEARRLFYSEKLAIDLFGEHVWVTVWEQLSPPALEALISEIRTQNAEIKSIVLMDRSKVATDADVVTVWGEPPQERFAVREFSVPYQIQFRATKHPGLFLDHAPLRQWLLKTQKDKTVLNLFAYTGSLSVAAGVGGATAVTTLDLSKSTIEWAQENWKKAGLNEAAGNFIYGDVFEWLPRLTKKGQSFDTILCDPPSFSRSKNGTFSTLKDSMRLHAQIFPLLKTGGTLVTSINSENIPEAQFLKDVQAGAAAAGVRVEVTDRIQNDRFSPYLKGFFLKRIT